MTQFYEWLLLQQERPDTVGHFAVQVAHDPKFPKQTRKLHVLLRYYSGCKARSAAKLAHAEWRASRREAQ